MIVYPDIELQNGRCVNLWRGQKNTPVVYDIEPVEAAINFVNQGAQWLHVVDLDAVFGDGDNIDIIKKIIDKADAQVQVAGAIRSIDTVRGWIEAGAARVVIATAAVKDPPFVRQAAFAYPGQVVLSVDSREGRVMVDGWRETTIFTPIEFARQFEDLPLAAVIYTDIDRDADTPESSMSQTAELAQAVKIPVIASGIIKTLDDISTIKFLPNIAGAITGRAIFGGDFELTDAIAIAEQLPEPIAPIA